MIIFPVLKTDCRNFGDTVSAISKCYGESPPPNMTYSAGKHPGIDITSSSIILCSVVNGVVYKKGYDTKGWGNYVVIKGDNGLYFIYAHLERVSSLLVVNSKVLCGEFVGYMGNTGKSTGIHLHFEIRKKYSDKFSTINPCEWLHIKDERGNIKPMENPSEFAKEAWEFCQKEGLLDGQNPHGILTREEFACVLQRLFDKLKK